MFSDFVPNWDNVGTTNDISPFSEQDMYFNSEFQNKAKRTLELGKMNISKTKCAEKSTKCETITKTKPSSDIIDALDQLFSKSNVKSAPKKYKVDLATRKDVVNKNTIRIISRYFKDLLAERFSGYKSTFKSAKALDNLLSEFCKSIFPQNFDSDLKYCLGAFVLAPKMKILQLDLKTQAKVNQIHKTLSKYTHKDLEKLVNCDDM